MSPATAEMTLRTVEFEATSKDGPGTAANGVIRGLTPEKEGLMADTMPPDSDRHHHPSGDLPSALWRGLASCPAESLKWAALAYRAGLIDGRAQLDAAVEDAGRIVAYAARPVLARPTFAELQRRRYGDAR